MHEFGRSLNSLPICLALLMTFYSAKDNETEYNSCNPVPVTQDLPSSFGELQIYKAYQLILPFQFFTGLNTNTILFVCQYLPVLVLVTPPGTVS